MLDSTTVWSECIRMEFVYSFCTVFVMHYFHTLHPISSHTVWNGKKNSAVQYVCMGRYLHAYLMDTEKCEATLEC